MAIEGYSMIRCFFMERTAHKRRWLRRYGGGPCPQMGGAYSYHDSRSLLGDVPDDGSPTGDSWSRDDPRWPVACACGYEFKPEDSWQLFHNVIYRRTDNGEWTTISESPPGAMWYADWMPKVGPDGHCLCIKLPSGGTWMPDQRASNCTLPDDNEHKCWVRHGAPPEITVDKNGLTCSAGAGSVADNDWHGFLRNGFLVS